MAPSNTASAARQASSVACGSGSPVRSMAMPPNGRFVELEFVAEAFADLLEHAHAFGDDFGTDAIARDDGNLCFHRAFIGALCS